MHEADGQYRVTTLELFFDLVFVFAITQLTGLLAHELSLKGLFQVALAFGVLWWMYAGYAWLTNTLTPTTPTRRLLLIGGMAGFLLVALATPDAFTGNGVLWGIGYLIVVLVHGGLYLQANRGILLVTPGNALAALLIIAAGMVHGAADYVLWTAALLIPILMPYVVSPGRFVLQAAHIVERHGLLVLITFGESVVAIGIGVTAAGEGKGIGTGQAVAAVLSLTLVAALWWTYFAGDDERAEEALTKVTDAPRAGMIINGYFYAHLPIVIGVIAVAAGLKKVLAHPWSPLHGLPSALALAGGVGLYLLGDVLFRRAMGIGPARFRILAIPLALATIPLAGWIGEAQVLALAAILTGTLIIEGRARPAASTTATTWDN